MLSLTALALMLLHVGHGCTLHADMRCISLCRREVTSVDRFTLNISRLAWCRRSSGRGVVLGLDASLSDRIMTSGDGVRLSWSTSLHGKTRKTKLAVQLWNFSSTSL